MWRLPTYLAKQGNCFLSSRRKNKRKDLAFLSRRLTGVRVAVAPGRLGQVILHR